MNRADTDPLHGDDPARNDDATARRGEHAVPLVGMGGSPSSIGAIRAFLRALPHGTGMAVLVTVHPHPGREIALAEQLRRDSKLPVVELDGSTPIEADHVYVIAPGRALQLIDGRLATSEAKPPRGRQVANDLFFRALADARGEHAAAIVLSGADGDGAIGIKRVKERGGLTIAQDPDEAESGGMPRSAIATGMVDWVLPVAEMPARLIEYQQLERSLELPAEEEPAQAEAPAPQADRHEASLREVLRFLRSRTGRDFSYYKRATVVRRIARRMQVNGVADMPAYLDCLRATAGEAAALLQDLLISVTNFFRDAPCFASLESALPELFKGKGAGDTVRVWVPACASGEEAYSIAILLAEHADTLADPPALQVFASDLDEHSIQIARAGVYPETIEADVTPERLKRFFVREHLGYRIRREMRESVLFAVHDLLRDSPFSRLDLVSCRNLLIYLTRDAQARAIDLFHFALRAEGLLFLGSSESIDESSPDFVVLDAKCRLYLQRPAMRKHPPLLTDPGTLALSIERAGNGGIGEKLAATDGASQTALVGRSWPPTNGTWTRPGDGASAWWATLHYRLLERIAPPSIIVDAEHEIVHLSESAGRFLQIAGGEPVKNLLRLVDPALRIELRAALFQAEQSGEPAQFGPVSLEIDGAPCPFKVRVVPGGELAPAYSMVLFEALTSDAEAAAAAPAAALHPMAEHLDREVERLKAHLRDTVEQYEASNEELKAGNEELQAMNEELRSATEELETGREELQSINEELSAVNAELKSKVDELGSANSDMLNLMDATAIPTVFLDRDLRITRYTPPAVSVFKLIPADVGRPLSDLRIDLDYPELAEDAERVLRRLAPVEREIARGADVWFLARMSPYRTIDDRIAGVVLTLVDISERRRTEHALREGEERLRLIFENAREYAIFSMDPGRRVSAWNVGAERILGYREAEVLGQLADIIFTEEDLAQSVPAREAATALVSGRAADDRFHRRKDGSRFWASGVMTPMHDAYGETIGFVKILRDQTEARRAQEALERSQADLLSALQETERARRSADLQRRHLEALFSEAPAPICILRGNENRVEFANPLMCQLWGQTCAAVVGKPLFEAVPEVSNQVFKDLLDGVLATGVPYVGKEVPARLDRRGSGETEDVYLNFTYAPLHDIDGSIDGVLMMASDVTDEVRAREQMSELHEAAQAAGRAKDDFLAMLGHELRNPLAPLQTSLHLLRQRVTSPDVDDLLRVMQRQSNNLARIVDDLLEASRISEGKIELRLESVDVADAAAQALEAARPFLQSREHRVDVTLPKRPLLVHADPVRIEQVVLNLLNNAGKYTPVGGRVGVTVRRAGEWAELVVADNGVGIPGELRPRLFQLFQQGNRDLARGEGGLGIGLSVVRRLVELHHGTVEARSDGPGHGSQFVVRLPLARAAAPAPGPAAPALRDGAPRSMRVLVVDDNRDAGETLAMLLDSLGHRTRLVMNGHEALAASDEWSPEVVFLDIGLPEMDGYEVAAELRRRSLDPPPRLVAVTGYGQDSDRAKSLRAGFDDHLVKPAAFAAIEAIVATVPAAERESGPAGERASDPTATAPEAPPAE
jgi:two-component system CheB/CheR fusion protein